jgi:diguanylate cyclase (GGDEF)-like protein
MNISKTQSLVLPVTWFGLALIAMIWFGIWFQIHSEFQIARDSADQKLQNYSRVFDEHIVRTVRELDKALLIARRRYLTARMTMPYKEAIGLKLPDPALLSDLSFQMATIDREGTLTATTIGTHPPKPIPLSDREHFQVHKTQRPDTAYISKPVLGRRSGRWSVQLTRKIIGATGSFDGVLVASMDPAHFSQFYSSIGFGEKDAVIFAGDDGYLRVATGTDTLKLGDQIQDTDLIRAAAKGNGVYRGDMDGADLDRLYALRRLNGWPLFVAVGTSYASIFTAAENNLRRYVAVGIVVSILILLAVAMSIRHHQTVARMARYDDLTGLANRARFREKLEAGAGDIRRGKKFALLFIDLDFFKAANDTFGHAFGDKLICVLAERMRKICRPNDLLARLAGDEFALVLKDIRGESAVAICAEQILATLRKPVVIGGQRISITASIGSAIAEDADYTPDQLFKHADLALHEAKTKGRDRHKIFQPEMAERAAERLQLERDLRIAIESQQLELFYQLIQSLDSEARCFETLLRWNHPDKGCISPMDFIPIAEDSGLIIPIGEWVLKQACQQATTFNPGIKIAVNISPVQFRDPDLYAKIVAALDESGLEPERLELEITESLMLDADAEVIKTIRQIRTLGVKIAMDDFGTGYSSLGYLCNFEFDRIKIDRSFIVGLDRHSNYAAVIRTIVNLAKSLNVRITAEGIETIQQLEMIRALGCTEAQGYLFSPPRPVEQIRHLTNPKSSMQPHEVTSAASTKEAALAPAADKTDQENTHLPTAAANFAR